MVSNRTYTDALPLKTFQQKALFGDKFFSRTELMLLIEMWIDKNKEEKKKEPMKITYDESEYYQREFYTGINSLIKKGLVKTSVNSKDKRKKVYELVNDKRTKYIMDMIFGGIMVNESPFKEALEKTGLTEHINSFLGNFSKKELIDNNFKTVGKKLAEEMKYGYNILDEIERDFDKKMKEQIRGEL